MFAVFRVCRIWTNQREYEKNTKMVSKPADDLFDLFSTYSRLGWRSVTVSSSDGLSEQREKDVRVCMCHDTLLLIRIARPRRCKECIVRLFVRIRGYERTSSWIALLQARVRNYNGAGQRTSYSSRPCDWTDCDLRVQVPPTNPKCVEHNVNVCEQIKLFSPF